MSSEEYRDLRSAFYNYEGFVCSDNFKFSVGVFIGGAFGNNKKENQSIKRP